MTRRVQHQEAPGGFVSQTHRVLGQVHPPWPARPRGLLACLPSGNWAIGVGV